MKISDEELYMYADSPVVELARVSRELLSLRAEVATARERLGPAGYRILDEVRKLRAENEKLKARLKIADELVNSLYKNREYIDDTGWPEFHYHILNYKSQ